jgi:hypothetical protein
MIEKATDGSEAEVVGLEKDAHRLQQLASLGIREEVGEAQEQLTMPSKSFEANKTGNPSE